MQRILQPGDIEALDHTRFPRVLLPQPTQLFADRAARLRQLAEGNPIADYLRFIATLADAQHHAVASVRPTPLPADAVADAHRHGMPLMPALDPMPAGWQQVLDTMLASLSGQAGLPEALQPLIEVLHTLDTQERNAIARRLLQNEGSARDVGLSPFVMAALQVALACRAAQIVPADVPHAEPATICPVCASAPVASVLRIGGQAAGHRYLHCGTCATEWHMVRVKCSHCESTQGVRYQGIEGGRDVVVAETCDACGTYRKLVNLEKDPLAEPLADDLASLTLDLLMGDTDFSRAGPNPLLFVAVAEPQAPAP
jgi:FdhE protein